MGYNTSVVVMNDALSAIEKDEEFGANLAKACLAASTNGRGHLDLEVPSKNYCNAACVIETHHADQLVPILVGGNCGFVVEGSLHWSDHTDEALLRMLAKRLGYKLVKVRK